MTKKRPSKTLTLELWKEEAEDAVHFAQATRELHRKHTKWRSPQRKADVAVAKRKIKKAMRPIRSNLVKIRFGDPEAIAAGPIILEISGMLQRERRKLWKLTAPRRKKRRN